MGFFDKLKSYVGLNDKPTITFERIEKTIPITDTGVKYRINVASKKDYTILSVTGVLKVKYKGDNDIEEEEILAEDTDNGKHWSDDQNPFPGIVNENSVWEFPGSVFMTEEANATMQHLANKVGFKLILEVTIDAKEIGGLFDPSIETEIFVTR